MGALEVLQQRVHRRDAGDALELIRSVRQRGKLLDLGAVHGTGSMVATATVCGDLSQADERLMERPDPRPFR